MKKSTKSADNKGKQLSQEEKDVMTSKQQKEAKETKALEKMFSGSC